jgi:DNA-binding NarL/FixJ family response regulator
MDGPARRTLLVSESDVLRAGLQSLCSAAGTQVVGHADSPSALEEAVRSTGAQLVVAAPVNSDSLGFHEALAALPRSCRVLVLLAVPGFRIRSGALRRRYGFTCLPLDVGAQALHAAIRDLFTDEPSTALAVERLCVGPEGVLSRREQEVLDELAQGLGNQAIAERLFVSQDTVKSHLRKIYRKLGVSSRSEAVALYVGELGGTQAPARSASPSWVATKEA